MGQYSLGRMRGVSNQQKRDSVETERSGTLWRSGELPEGPIVAYAPIDYRKLLVAFDIGMANPGWGLAMFATAMFAMIAIVPRVT